MATVSATPSVEQRRRESVFNGQMLTGLLMGGPSFLLLIGFLILPFFLAFGFSFTNQRLISPNPTEFVGLRNYSRLVRMAVLPLEPLVDEQTGGLLRDEAGALEYPRSRDFTRDEENYPQYAGLREWFSLDAANTRYVVLAADPTFLRSLLNSFYFALVVIPLQTGLGLGAALLVNQQVRGVNFFRTAYFIPVVTSMVVLAIIWAFLYDKDRGLINEFLATLSFGCLGPVNWLGDPATAMPAIIIMSAWQGAGFQMVIFLAGLQGIPQSLYEAASIDGANRFQQFWYVTIPGLRNTFVFIIITITIAAFQLFVQPWVMTNGGPADSTTTVAFHMVRKGFQEQDIGYASAISVVFFVIILAVSMVQRYLLREEEA